MPFPFLRPPTLRQCVTAASTRADCAEREPIPPHQFRAGDCRAGTRIPIVRVCAAVVLAAVLVSGLATGTRDAAAAAKKVSSKRDFLFGSVAGDADLAGTVVVSPAQAKTVTGGASDFGDVHQSSEFEVESDNPGESLTCTLPSSITVTSGGNSMTVDTFTSNPLLSNIMPPGEDKISVFIGATLHLAAGQAAGDYENDYTFICGAESDTTAVKIKVFAPISISSGGDMDFGTLAADDTAGTVTVTPAGARTSVNVYLFGGFPTAASFDVTGASGQAYSITFPSPATLTSGGNTMTVDTFNHDAGATPTLVGGSDTFNVGATLHVGAAQASGTYSGTFDVTVSYN